MSMQLFGNNISILCCTTGSSNNLDITDLPQLAKHAAGRILHSINYAK